jgi:hypothetical protein
MKTHDDIDKRSLALSRAIAERINQDPAHKGLEKARQTCARWLKNNQSHAVEEWIKLLEQDWDTIRTVLLDEGEEGKRLRQSNPFCGILSPHERWAIYRRFNNEPKTA